ncbi:Glutathione amide reductase [Sinobacterium norvegicum]|uniref:Glutathione amide reductase n=1 Tax=Sinobacterium norvegicum TaxID=1641715 RepID=A0ABN8EG48_9GAMM|nr:glutathione-disulfide reductase [Sinobacterium norvegicum]CAH0990312.1 Glutathione amide reductase [Sinobacterium norvegicum]
MTSFDYDLLVIGAGSGGVRCARMSASFGAKVAVVEGQYWGGTCVNVGCVPKKLYSYAAHYHEDFTDARGFGWLVDKPSFNWPTLRDNKTKEIKRLNSIYTNMLSNAGVELIHGYATMLTKHELEIVDSDGNKQTVTAKNILLGTGGKPVLPEIMGIEKSVVSDQVFDLDTFPRVLTILGSGYIAVEFACIFNGLGAEVHLICRGDRVLRGFDNEIAYELTAQMQQKGITIHSETLLSSVEGEQGDLTLTLANGTRIATNQLMTAVGRSPNLEFIGSLADQLSTDQRGYVVVDDNFKTSIDNVYAVGDLIGGMELTPVALAEGMAVAHELYSEQSKPVDYRDIATAVFSHPNIGTVGLTEEQAREQYSNIDVFKSKFRHMKHTLSGNEEKTLMKIIVDADTDKVLGLHILGSDAGEIVQGFAVALKAGATKATFDATIGIHPTAAEELVTMREPS